MSCPSHNTLSAFALGEASSRAAEIAAHVDGCTPCQQFLGGVIQQLLDYPDPVPLTPGEEASVLDHELKESWQDFLARYGVKLGIRITPPAVLAVGCPSPQALTDFILGEPTHADEIAAHLDSCEACTRFLDGVYHEADEAWQQYLKSQGASSGGHQIEHIRQPSRSAGSSRS